MNVIPSYTATDISEVGRSYPYSFDIVEFHYTLILNPPSEGQENYNNIGFIILYSSLKFRKFRKRRNDIKWIIGV